VTSKILQLIPAIQAPPQETQHLPIAAAPVALDASAFLENMPAEFPTRHHRIKVRPLHEGPSPEQNQANTRLGGQ
jgi:hypothetical protein